MKRSCSDMQSTPVLPQRSVEKGGHQPRISRKIRACQECQSRKIKCGIEPGQQACSRCQRLGLRCIVNKSLQTLLEDESEWKTSMETQTSQLQDAVAEILRALNLPTLDKYGTPATTSTFKPPGEDTPVKLHSPQPSSSPGSEPRRPHVHGLSTTRESSSEPPVPEAEQAPLVTAPMASLLEVTKLRSLRSCVDGRAIGTDRSNAQEDLISRGRVSLEDGESLFRAFGGRLAAYLWGGIPLVHQSLSSARASSPLLVAAILAVTALHLPGKEETFDTCYVEFLELVSASMFDRCHSLDDVRGLVIGAFWLSDVSWKLSGHAVRIGTELNLHQSFAKAIRGDGSEVEKARLWYLLYVCDHHFSIAYGRPPVIEQDVSISCHELFLQLPGITNHDLRLHSQVGVFLILSKMFLTFGSIGSKELNQQEVQHLTQYNQELTDWRLTWEPRLAPNKYIGVYPAKGVELHYHFARLQLNALALRGITPSPTMVLSHERRNSANFAIASAIACLQMVLEEPSIRDAVVGVPLYLHTNIVFAAVFLMKVSMRWKAAHFEQQDDTRMISLIERVVKLLRDGRASERHLTYHIARGLDSMLDTVKEQSYQARTPLPSNAVSRGPLDAHDMEMSPHWPSMGYPQTSMGDMVDLCAADHEYFPLGMFHLTAQMPG